MTKDEAAYRLARIKSRGLADRAPEFSPISGSGNRREILAAEEPMERRAAADALALRSHRRDGGGMLVRKVIA